MTTIQANGETTTNGEIRDSLCYTCRNSCNVSTIFCCQVFCVIRCDLYNKNKEAGT